MLTPFARSPLVEWMGIKRTSSQYRRGILQRFLQPKGDYHNVIQLQWQPEFVLYEKIQNKNKINNLNMDVYQRIVTWELLKTSLQSSVMTVPR